MADHAPDTTLGDAVAAFERVRRQLFGIAYRMLGSATEAEDIVQEAWLRWQSTDRSVVRNPAAFLVTTTTRLALNAASSARARHEVYVGPWLPEPVRTVDDPTLGAERTEALEVAVLVLLERLTPTERAVYVLREAFDYPYSQIAEVLELSEANTRQIAHRAKDHIAEERHEPVSAEQRDRLLRAFVNAARLGDLETLEGLLAENVVALSDGGGVVSAGRRPVVGRDNVGRFLTGIVRKGGTGFEIATVQANGQTSLLVSLDGAPYAVVSIDASPAGIERVFLVVNPAKLGAFA